MNMPWNMIERGVYRAKGKLGRYEMRRDGTFDYILLFQNGQQVSGPFLSFDDAADVVYAIENPKAVA